MQNFETVKEAVYCATIALQTYNLFALHNTKLSTVSYAINCAVIPLDIYNFFVLCNAKLLNC